MKAYQSRLSEHIEVPSDHVVLNVSSIEEILAGEIGATNGLVYILHFSEFV